MSTVGESQDPPWMDVLYTKGLSAAATILEEYGLSCESDMSLVDEDDLVVLCSKLKPFQSKLLRKWVQGLGAEQRAAAFMKDASAAKNHSTSPPLEDKGAEDEDEEENGDEDADADEDEDSDEEDKEVHGGAAGEQGAGDGKSDEDVRIIGQQSAQHHKEDGKRATECVNDAAAAKKAKTSTLSTEQQSFVSKFNPAPAKIDKERKISTRNVKGRLNSLKKQGARLNDVKGATILSWRGFLHHPTVRQKGLFYYAEAGEVGIPGRIHEQYSDLSNSHGHYLSAHASQHEQCVGFHARQCIRQSALLQRQAQACLYV